MCDKPPAPSALPPGVGRDRWLLGRWCFATRSSESCGEFHEGARCEPRRPNPRQEAPQTWGAAPKARGACPRTLRNLQQEAHLWGAAPKARGACHTLCKTHNKPPCAPKTDQPTPGLPPSRDRRSRYRGRRKRSDREGGPRGAHVTLPAKPPLQAGRTNLLASILGPVVEEGATSRHV